MPKAKGRNKIQQVVLWLARATVVPRGRIGDPVGDRASKDEHQCGCDDEWQHRETCVLKLPPAEESC